MDDQPIIAPSILSADFAHLARDIAEVENGGATWIHVDVMDGRFVPNITIGPPVIKAVRAITSLPLDVHLMIEEPGRHIASFAAAGADLITIHVEAEVHLHRTLQAIRHEGCRAGVSLNPGTSLALLDGILPFTDMVLLMSVNPGFGGQTFIEETYHRLDSLVSMRQQAEASFLISVDGGVTLENARRLFDTGVDVLVAGSTIFNSSDRAGTIALMKSLRRNP